jgi:tetratricopeptide (TPR) repeat protein
MPLDVIFRRMGWDRNKKTLSVPPRVSEDVLERARAHHAAGYYEKGLEQLSGLQACADDPRCLRIIGLCYLGLQKTEEAIEVFSLAREMSRTELARDEANLCAALLTARRFAEARAAAQRAVDLAPSEALPHVNMIGVLQRSNANEELEQYLATLKRDFPDVIRTPYFQERMDRDPDLVGVSEYLKDGSEER